MALLLGRQRQVSECVLEVDTPLCAGKSENGPHVAVRKWTRRLS